MPVASPERVRCSTSAIVVSAVLWLVLPAGWPTVFWFIVVGVQLAAPAQVSGFTVLVMAALAIPAALLWWPWWRFAGVRARPLPDGLLLRGMWRTHRVPWHRVTGVESTEFVSAGRSFYFSWTIVSLRPPSSNKVATVIVSRSHRSGSAGQRMIQSWLPPRHRLHRPPPPDASTTTDLSTQPVLTTLRPPTALQAIYSALLAAVLGPALWFAVVCARRVGDGAVYQIGLLALAATALGTSWLLVRVWRARVDLTPAGLVNRGYFADRSYAIEAIEDFRLAPSGAGQAALLVLAGQGTRYLAAGVGFGRYPDQTRHTLRAWWSAHRRH